MFRAPAGGWVGVGRTVAFPRAAACGLYRNVDMSALVHFSRGGAGDADLFVRRMRFPWQKPDRAFFEKVFLAI